MVLRRCRKLLREEGKAADAMQETFVNLISNQKRLTGQAPSSLLYRMATNVCLNVIRSEKGSSHDAFLEEVLEIPGTNDPGPSWASRSILSKIFSAQKELSDYISVLFYLDEMTLEEISREVGLSVSGVRKRLRHVKLAAEKYKEGV